MIKTRTEAITDLQEPTTSEIRHFVQKQQSKYYLEAINFQSSIKKDPELN